MSRRTNLCNIVQNRNERVIILERSSQISFSINSHKEDYLLSEHLEPVSLVSHGLGGYQGRQDGVLLQLGLVWSKRVRVLPESP